MSQFTLGFGKKPATYINRPELEDKIIHSFQSDQPDNYVFMISGVRGSGKTVFMEDVASDLAKDKRFIVIDLNPETDLLESLASKLYDAGRMQKIFLKANFNFSFRGISFSISGENPIINVETLLERMLVELKKQGKRLLITIDEVTGTKGIKEFAHTFQSFLRKDFPVFLLMTGLFKNIYDLQNQPTLTFLYRAPRLVLGPISTFAVIDSYASIFSIQREEAIKLALFTKGYAFAYQALGFILVEQKKTAIDESVVMKFDEILRNYVYEKIWGELSKEDKTFLLSIGPQETSTGEAMQKCGFSKEKFSVYRSRADRSGLIDTSVRGSLSVALPRFYEYIELMQELMDIRVGYGSRFW